MIFMVVVVDENIIPHMDRVAVVTVKLRYKRLSRLSEIASGQDTIPIQYITRYDKAQGI